MVVRIDWTMLSLDIFLCKELCILMLFFLSSFKNLYFSVTSLLIISLFINFRLLHARLQVWNQQLQLLLVKIYRFGHYIWQYFWNANKNTTIEICFHDSVLNPGCSCSASPLRHSVFEKGMNTVPVSLVSINSRLCAFLHKKTWNGDSEHFRHDFAHFIGKSFFF